MRNQQLLSHMVPFIPASSNSFTTYINTIKFFFSFRPLKCTAAQSLLIIDIIIILATPFLVIPSGSHQISAGTTVC